MRSLCVYMLLIAATACYGLPEKVEYTGKTEATKQHPAEERPSSIFVRPRNSSKVAHANNNDREEDGKFADKEARTTARLSPNGESRDNSSCCSSRYSSGSLTRPDPHYNRIPAETGRYPSQYGERLPVDRYGWQTQGRPPGPGGTTGRPEVFDALYGGIQPGDRYNSRPSHGSEGPGRPGGYAPEISGGYSYGHGGAHGGYGSGRPLGQGGFHGVGSYGISGTLADGDKFGPGELNYSEGNAPPASNIYAQKAVALKALAGVALIGAAAALATNPVLLPIGLVSGRRKRSELSQTDEDVQMDYILKMLKLNLIKVYSKGGRQRLLVSPRCVARLTCEIQRNYLTDLRKDVEFLRESKDSEQRLANLIRSNILNVDSVSESVKKLIESGVSVASTGGNCNLFACSFIKTG